MVVEEIEVLKSCGVVTLAKVGEGQVIFKVPLQLQLRYLLKMKCDDNIKVFNIILILLKTLCLNNIDILFVSITINAE